jgi:hypothetical protein
VQPLVVLIHRGPRACWILVSYLSEGCVSELTSSLTFSLLRREGAQVQYSPPGTIREKQLRLLPRNPRWATLVLGCWAAQRLAQSPGTQAYHNLRRVFCTYLHGVFLAYCYLTRGEGLRYTGQRGCGMGRPSCTGYSMLIIYPLLLPPYIYLYL